MPTSQHLVVKTDILELRSQIEKKIGRVKTETYLNLLSKFLNFKISKSDFDKLIIATVKKENINLHNALLRGILKNVCLLQKPQEVDNEKKQFNGVLQRSLSLCKDLPKSPRKGRTQRRFNGNKGKSQNGEEVDQFWKSQRIEAPFGVNFREVVKTRHHTGTCYSTGELPDSISLKKKLENDSGLAVSDGFANVLNAGLDVYLKRLIKPCLELAASRSLVGSSTSSLVDFQVAMELNPSILGENWPTMLEKIRLAKPDLPSDFQTS